MKSAKWLFLCALLLLGLFSGAAAQNSIDSLDEEDLIDDETANVDMKTHEAEPETASTTTPPPPVKTVPYAPPASLDNFVFAETFDGDVMSRWFTSAAEKFTGHWEVLARKADAIVGDVGLRIMDAAHHHGIATSLTKGGLKENMGKPIVVSYEAMFEDGLQCGGGYLKLFDSKALSGSDLHSFDNETPYVVMFGPDRCGVTNKVHLIIKHKNPVNNEWVEHHLENPPRVPIEQTSHVYAFHLKPDNTYEIYVDGKVEKSGSMLTDFVPPFTPPTEIDDPEDVKPEDWVDAQQIPDPESVKPDDWDEDAPQTLPDPNVSMPEGWLEDEPKLIPDPEAVKPEEWNEEEDGEWTAAVIANPACKDAPGCGEWKAPRISNPDYKGPWTPKRIPNPDYIGPWSPRKIPNPVYFENKNPHAIADVDSVGFELWTMQSGLLFDNIVVNREIEPVLKFIDSTWKVRRDIEDAMNVNKPKPIPESLPGMSKMSTLDKVIASTRIAAEAYPMGFGIASVAFVSLLVMTVMKMFKSSPAPEATKAAVTKKNDEPASDDTAEEEEADKSQEELTSKEKKPATRKRAAKKD